MHNVNWDNLDTIRGAQRANGRLNCPNCGAPIDGEKCAYCGTVFIDMSCIDADAPFFMKIKHGDNIYVAKVRLRSVTREINNSCIYGNRVALFDTFGEEVMILTLDISKGE